MTQNLSPYSIYGQLMDISDYSILGLRVCYDMPARSRTRATLIRKLSLSIIGKSVDALSSINNIVKEVDGCKNTKKELDQIK